MAESTISEVSELNNGFIPHRIEDRLGLKRGSVVVWADEDGNLFASHEGREIKVLPEDNREY